MNLTDELIEIISTNRISTTEIADALGKTGSLFGLAPLSQGKHIVGKIHHIKAFNGSNFEVHKQIINIPPGHVIFIECINFGNVAVIGDLISKSVLLYGKSKAIIVDGFVRDTSRLIKENYAIWCKGSNPVGAVNFDNGIIETSDLSVSGGIAVCDDGGVVIIPPNAITAELIRLVTAIELQEDIWYFCLDTLKWNTFEIVCEKKYLDFPDLLPPDLRSNFHI